MRAFVVKLRELFVMDTGKPDPEKNFQAERRSLRIPLYQREYKWENEKINALISDISKQHKFLGNVILDESVGCYEIADGQQRITTCYLVLVYLYNYYQGSPLEQESILNILQPYDGEFVLRNDSVKSYLQKHDHRIALEISDIDDVYFQKSDFLRAEDTIATTLSSLANAEQVREFKSKLLDSEVLVLINDENTSTPIEQIFLDINEKAQLLEIEDIFKGHCFEIFAPEFHDRLRETWVSLKKYAAGFSALGIKSLSEYIYLFLLEHDSNTLPHKLNPNGRHYLEGKTMDDTNTLLHDMIQYGHSVLQFKDNLQNAEYRFSDICQNSFEYRNTNDHLALKAMGQAILSPGKPLYQKLPFMYFIYQMTKNADLQRTITHDVLRRITTNLYIYCSFFILNTQKKSKSVIDHTMRDAIRSQEHCFERSVTAAKALRIAAIEDYAPNYTAKYEELSVVYSITDNYIANLNWLPVVYSKNNGHTLEHFLIPDQRASRIHWNDNQRILVIQLDSEFAKTYKKKTCNLLIMDKLLNESLNVFDIVTKIEKIKRWYVGHGEPIPNHITTVIAHIEDMPTYQTLQVHKGDNASDDTIRADYLAFLAEYFSEENELRLMSLLTQKLYEVFRN